MDPTGKPRLWIEQWTPCVLAVLSTLILIGLQPDISEGDGDDITAVANALIAVSGIILGFLITTVSILYILPSSRFLSFMIENKLLKGLMVYTREAVLWWLFVLILGLLYLIVSGMMGHKVLCILYLLLITTVGGIASFFRSMWLSTRLLIVATDRAKSGK